MAKHGNRAQSSQSGAHDVLEALGLNPASPPELSVRCLREAKLAFLFAPAYHAATKHAVGPRNLRGPAACLVAAWCAGAKRNASLASRRQRADSSGDGAGSSPSASMTSCAPDCDDCARLPCLATATPAPATMNAAIVDTLIDREPSPPVPQVSTIASAVEVEVGMRARIARAAPTTSSTVSPFMRSAASSAPICAGVAWPSMIWPTTAAISSDVRSLRSTTRASASRIPSGRLRSLMAGPPSR